MTNEELLDQALGLAAAWRHNPDIEGERDEARSAVLARMVGWQPLCAVSDLKGLGEVLLRAFYPDRDTASDVYHGWYSRGDWVRWPHTFPPTHYMTIGQLPAHPGARP